MRTVKVNCTSCGAHIDTIGDLSQVECEYCGSAFLLEDGEDFALKSEEDIGSIKKLRNNLERSVLADDHKNILAFSKEILRLVPRDDRANYYFAYANYSFGSRRYLFDFYDHTVRIPNHSNKIIDHIIEYSDVRDKSLVETFIARHNPDKIEPYREKYKQKLIDEENYSSIPRDVFISFRSTEIEIANQVLETLEKDGSSCWISSRNLRPNDNENYWANIEDAITKCKVFLVISSNEAMISRDVRKELDIASKLGKKRIEFKIDNVRHTSTFKYFFDGLKWVDATENIKEALTELKKRVYTLLTESNTTYKQNSATGSSDADSSDFIRKINRSKVDLIGGNFQEAANTIKDALAINPESYDAWWLLFLAENDFPSTEAFNNHLAKKSTISKMADLSNKVSFKQFKKFAPKDINGTTTNTKIFEDNLYELILEYINKPNLPSKSKREYLHAYLPNHILTLWADNILMKGFTTDTGVSKLIEDTKGIKELENVFDDFEELKAHPMYDSSHVKEYYDRFFKNYERVLKKRENDLKELTILKEKLYDNIDDLLYKSKFKEAYQASQELFYVDNNNELKFMYLLLSKLKAQNTIDLYDGFSKLKKSERDKLLKSQTMERLFRSERFSPLIYDLALHLNYKKVKRSDRISISLRGEVNEM